MLRVRLPDGRMLNLQRQGRIGFYGQSTGQGGGDHRQRRRRDGAGLDRAGAARGGRRGVARLSAGAPDRAVHGARRRAEPRPPDCRATTPSAAGNFISMSQRDRDATRARDRHRARGEAQEGPGRRDRIPRRRRDVGARFHSALNFAAVWKAPVVFFCRNNQWAISVPVSKQTASRTPRREAVATGCPAYGSDGN